MPRDVRTQNQLIQFVSDTEPKVDHPAFRLLGDAWALLLNHRLDSAQVAELYDAILALLERYPLEGGLPG